MKTVQPGAAGLRRMRGKRLAGPRAGIPSIRYARSCAPGSCLLVLALAGAAACTTFDAGPGSLATRREVNAVNLLAREVDAEVARNGLRVLRESVECDGGSVVKQATLFSDASGRPRKYALEGQTRDSAHYLFYYYDTGGRLRLVDSDQRAGTKSQRTSRLYFDRGGRLVHKDERVSGPPVSFHEASERRDPAADIRSLADPRDGCRRVAPRR